MNQIERKCEKVGNLQGCTNFNRQMARRMARLPKGTPLLLHVCCGPCASAVIERLAAHFSLTLLYANPNIWPEEEYRLRFETLRKLLQALPTETPVAVDALPPWEHEAFLRRAEGHEAQPEGGSRCAACFALRLEAAARRTAELGLGLFTTTLTVSPHKNAALLNELGASAAARWQVEFLNSDFKKQNGYARSIQLSREYGLYRQNYCGCEFSLAQRGQNS